MIHVYTLSLCGNTSPTELSSAAHRLLGRALYECFGLSDGTYTVGREENGKPYIVGADVFVSITHTVGFAAVAVGDTAVGIDAEAERPISKAIRDRWLGGCSESEAVAEWTKREAYGKMTGEGFVFSLPMKPHRFMTKKILGRTVTVCTENAADIYWH